MKNPNKFERKVKIEDSSQIQAVCYDPATNEMAVQFVDGSWYQYEKVPNIMFGNLVSADSVGVTFHQLFRRNEGVKYTKVDLTNKNV